MQFNGHVTETHVASALDELRACVSHVRVLGSFSPPNVGVVGPLCAEGNTLIMTHDFVHRTHLEIFEHYYPPVFSDWWMDDWISKVRSQWWEEVSTG